MFFLDQIAQTCDALTAASPGRTALNTITHSVSISAAGRRAPNNHPSARRHVAAPLSLRPASTPGA
jgi:hypothetical protein